jgi:hypothetical protein
VHAKQMMRGSLKIALLGALACFGIAFRTVCNIWRLSSSCVLRLHLARARANITLAHIWRPEKAKQLSELTFIDVLRIGTIPENRGARKHYACAQLASGEGPTAL